MRVTVMHSTAPRQVLEWVVDVPPGSTVRQAVLASGLPQACPQLDLAACEAGVWGKRCDWDRAVRADDRVEIYRPLLVDPKVARRERFRKQGARAAGLFARQRPGGKAGY
ncbi:MAG TPA: RnfH family protein [Ramlibacter sp.]|jgi:putative ubiquitin-RnfH superfamily antitoxin RatB of RatAB toxin-antitoxin module